MQINFNAKLIFTFFIYTFLSYYNNIKKQFLIANIEQLL